ncbi:hypothetical protein Asi02nite_61170 [Asanoa siamensis]|uniref:Uncharacterized protein n=1 Tax=Asanoa siamensis TaxID=926357 RepID=A0ABQ4CZ95_9ACTN|nr:hypothetical protein Asi02nite_61170 [Asanoa siamensis]
MPAEPPGREHLGGGPQPLGELVLGALVDDGRPDDADSHLSGIDNGSRLPMQRGGLQGSRLRPRHNAHLPRVTV